MCTPMCMQVPWRPEEDVRSPSTGIPVGCEPPHRTKPSPPEDQPVLLTIESSLWRESTFLNSAGEAVASGHHPPAFWSRTCISPTHHPPSSQWGIVTGFGELHKGNLYTRGKGDMAQTTTSSHLLCMQIDGSLARGTNKKIGALASE